MLDIVDKTLKYHIQNYLKINGKPIPLFSAMTSDQDDQPLTQSGTVDPAKPDVIELPFASLIRLPDIEISDNPMTKVVHTYQGYQFIEGDDQTVVTYNRCTLSYVITLFAVNRKQSEDLAAALFAALRSHCQLSITVFLPVEKDGKVLQLPMEMDSDIVMDGNITQQNQQQLDKAQFYKARMSFKLKNVNLYTLLSQKKYSYHITVLPQNEQGQSGLVQSLST